MSQVNSSQYYQIAEFFDEGETDQSVVSRASQTRNLSILISNPTQLMASREPTLRNVFYSVRTRTLKKQKKHTERKSTHMYIYWNG